MIWRLRLAGMAAVILAIDRASKWAVVEWLGLRDIQRIDVWPGLLSLRMAWNRGVNFGLFSTGAETMRWFLTGLAVALSVAVFVWAMRRNDARFSLGAGALIGGALGNAYDRVTYGAVADFLNVTCCGIVNPFAFNVADVAIFAGAATLALLPSAGSADAR